VPRDDSFPRAGLEYLARVLEDVRGCYGWVRGGRTFVYEPLIVQVSRHSFAELAADNFQAWWPLLQREFAEYGWAWNARARFKLLSLTHRAGADSENGGIDSTAQAGRVDRGNRGGFAIIGDSSVGGVLAGVCPEIFHGKVIPAPPRRGGARDPPTAAWSPTGRGAWLSGGRRDARSCESKRTANPLRCSP
jgi:hypothetical protein